MKSEHKIEKISYISMVNKVVWFITKSGGTVSEGRGL